jgi:predicted Ser/Thr protein kinase
MVEFDDNALVEWMEHCIAHGENVLAQGYQGQVYFYEDGAHRWVVKAASGRGLMRWLRRRMLRREHRVYQRLRGMPGCPQCLGLVRGRYLVLEYIDGVPLRRAPVTDPAAFYRRLFALIEQLHARGVAHSDMKRKDNLLVVGGDTPCLIDFGAAMLRAPGFAPLNHYLFRIAQRFDYNAWIKLKYNNRLDEIAPADRAFYRRTWVEKFARHTKRAYQRLRYGRRGG